ncbi:MAG: tetratricopeptide repeat protein, partial [Thermodesulfobacteriota bacterium]
VPDVPGRQAMPLSFEVEHPRRTTPARVLILGLGLLAAAVLALWWWPETPAPAPPAGPARVVATPAPQAASRPAEPAQAEPTPAPPAAAPPEPAETGTVVPEPQAPTPSPEAEAAEARERFTEGSAAQDEGRFQEAVAHYLAALEADPKLTDAYINLGNIYFFEHQDAAKARDMYETALSLAPNNKLVHNNLGVLFLQEGDLGQAETHLAAAVELDPEYVDGWYNLACLAARQGLEALAMTHLLKAGRIQPEAAVWAAGDEDLRVLRPLPEFQQFVESAGAGRP